jgi:glycosyltransferase involved in cell wall biosynthesis
MRILHVAEAFGGGIYEMVRILAAGAASAGHDVGIAYGRRPETPERVEDEVPPPVELFPMPWLARTPRAQVEATRALHSLVGRWEPDVVHLHSSFAEAVGVVAVRSRVPTVYSPHAHAFAVPGESRLRRLAFLTAERLLARRVTLIGAVSRSEARVAEEKLKAPRVVTVENGIPELDPERMIERALPARPRVIAVGRTVPQRRPEASARILASVRDIADVEWVGGGGGGRGTAGQSALAAAGIPLSGWAPRGEVLRALGETTAYLHWTAWDGQPLSVLEALSRDAVVIASDIEPNREVLGPEQVFGSEDQAAAALRRVLLDADYAEALRSTQRERRGRWGASRMVAAWLEVYEELAADPRTAIGVAPG